MQRSIWGGSIGNRLEKGRHLKKYFAGDWINHPIPSMWSNSNQSDQQTIWPAEPLGKSNSYQSLQNSRDEQSQSGLGRKVKTLFPLRKAFIVVLCTCFDEEMLSSSDRTGTKSASMVSCLRTAAIVQEPKAWPDGLPHLFAEHKAHYHGCFLHRTWVKVWFYPNIKLATTNPCFSNVSCFGESQQPICFFFL